MKIIHLRNDRGDVQVDDADYDHLMIYRWYVMYSFGRPYAASKETRDGKRCHVYMHRMLLRPDPGLVVDHIDGNSLNNQRSNLRTCTRAQNSQNAAGRKIRAKSGVRGVYWHAQSQSWAVAITANGEHRCLGYRKTLAAAADLRRAGEITYFGQFAAAWSGSVLMGS